MTEQGYRARRNGRESRLTVAQYWALPAKKRHSTEMLVDGNWVRPERFVGDGSEITVEKSSR